jgi:hypothetical protein
MKKAIFIMLCMAVCFSTMFSTTSYAQDFVNSQRFCKTMYSLAESMMMARQQGRSLMEMHDDIIKAFPDNPETQNALINIVNLAFRFPKFELEENQETISREFATKIYMMCIDN